MPSQQAQHPNTYKSGGNIGCVFMCKWVGVMDSLELHPVQRQAKCMGIQSLSCFNSCCCKMCPAP